MMDIDSLREYCLSFAHATEDIKWGNDLLFRVGGKIFAAMDLEPAPVHRLSFKCTPEEFAELIEKENIIPAPYSARYHWVTLLEFDALKDAEIKRLINKSYEMVFAKLPNKVKKQLESQSH